MSRARMTVEQAKERIRLQRIREANRKRILHGREPDMSSYVKMFAWIPDVINVWGRDLGRVVWLRTYYIWKSYGGDQTMMPPAYERHYKARKGNLDYAIIRDARLRGEDV